MPQPVRTFIAAEISGEVHACAAKAIEQLSKVNVDVKWSRLDNVHLTIKFLGDVDYTGLSDVCRALGKAVSGMEPVEVECGRIGAFPKLEKPRTIWLGIDDPEERLARLAAAVEDAMADIRFRRDSRPFRPHLTLGRLRDGRDSRALAEQLQASDFSMRGGLVIDELIVFSSELTKDGPIYTVVGRVELDG